jgi:hypothetical protein
MVAAGVGLMFTGIGGPAGLALVGASGALFSAGANTKGAQPDRNGLTQAGRALQKHASRPDSAYQGYPVLTSIRWGRTFLMIF